MNFPEIRFEDVVGFLVGANFPIPGIFLVFGVILILAIWIAKRGRRKMKEHHKALIAKQARGAQEQDAVYDDNPESFR